MTKADDFFRQRSEWLSIGIISHNGQRDIVLRIDGTYSGGESISHDTYGLGSSKDLAEYFRDWIREILVEQLNRGWDHRPTLWDPTWIEYDEDSPIVWVPITKRPRSPTDANKTD